MATGDSESDPFVSFREAVRILFGEEYLEKFEMCPTGSASSNLTTATKRFELPPYQSEKPDLWFLTCEIIFEDHSVTTERQKFSAILQRLGAEQVNIIENVIRQKPDDPYTQAKERLIAADGESEEEKLNKLLRGADIPEGTKPCIVLQRLRALVGHMPNADDLVRPIWIQKLPIRTQEILSANRNDPLDTICKTADKMHEIAERSSSSVHAVTAAASAPKPTLAVDDCLAAVLRSLTTEIAALRAERREYQGGRERDRSRDRDRSYNRYSRRSRSRSQTPGRSGATDMYDGVCWYHYTYGDKARNCAPGCKRAGQGNDK